MTMVFLVDDHEIVRGGIAALINAERDLEVVGEAGLVKQVLPRIAATQPDVVVLDVRLPDGNGIDLCRDIRSAYPEVQCLMLTGYDDDQASQLAVLAGASGYVIKDIRGQGLIESIRKVARGERLVTRLVTQQAVAQIASVAFGSASGADGTLSTRERQVLDLIGDGLTNKQIGDQLGLAEKTVKNYVSTMLEKLGMERRTQAAVYTARRKGDA